eukprot:TRINITY_DN4845_c0_g1_i1.p1 TRINITY_DN4845_c0_g1~~TRINITY_DN4845_c0_g1_i1.p1  ORF type:complete len:128 (+),score=5.65 TRINITY_DN4845_c0_g1_i1:39-386(+)
MSEEGVADYIYVDATNAVLDAITEADNHPWVIWREADHGHYFKGEWDTHGICSNAFPLKDWESTFQWRNVVARNMKLKHELEQFSTQRVRLLETSYLSWLRLTLIRLRIPKTLQL